jgi:hypothetical protein
MRNRVKRESGTILVSLTITLLAFSVLAFIRFFDSETFLFTQLLVLSVFFLFFLYLYTTKRQDRLSKILQGRELVSVLVVFTVLSFLLLNIDRSRSVYLLKWVSTSESFQLRSQEFLNLHANSGIEIRDLQQRLTEQESIKTITVSDEGVELTTFGRFIIKTSYFVARFQNLKGFKSN